MRKTMFADLNLNFVITFSIWHSPARLQSFSLSWFPEWHKLFCLGWGWLIIQKVIVPKLLNESVPWTFPNWADFFRFGELSVYVYIYIYTFMYDTHIITVVFTPWFFSMDLFLKNCRSIFHWAVCSIFIRFHHGSPWRCCGLLQQIHKSPKDDEDCADTGNVSRDWCRCRAQQPHRQSWGGKWFCDLVASIGSGDEPPQKYLSVLVGEILIHHSSVLWVFHDVIVYFAIWVGQTACDGF